ncbi:hypothetical protein ILUMI_00883 [Ignelater luminosus]|uniref:Uncharacterized protein n=1 Tax=Ignelater luminosus TaxID=2038154 RepID=A0A8K0DGD4_IGNLU|nr:hypothetical protein ILUMI_00883 [Ignelater luminosus]
MKQIAHPRVTGTSIVAFERKPKKTPRLSSYLRRSLTSQISKSSGLIEKDRQVTVAAKESKMIVKKIWRIIRKEPNSANNASVLLINREVDLDYVIQACNRGNIVLKILGK